MRVHRKSQQMLYNRDKTDHNRDMIAATPRAVQTCPPRQIGDSFQSPTSSLHTHSVWNKIHSDNK